MFKSIRMIFLGAAVFCGIFAISCSSPTSTPAPSPAIGNWSGTVSLTDSELVSGYPTKLNVAIGLQWYITSSSYTRTVTDTLKEVSDTLYDSLVPILLGIGGYDTIPVIHVGSIMTTVVLTDTGTWTTSGNVITCSTPRMWESVNGATPTIETAPERDTTSLTGISGNTWSFPTTWTKLNGSSATAALALTK